MKLIITGPPGTGKGTQAKLLAKKYKLKSFSAGQLLRQEAQNPTIRGKRIARIINKGNLVSDRIVLKIVKQKLKKRPDNFILDGFPRDCNQIKDFKTKFDAVIYIKSTQTNIIKRLKRRKRKDDTLNTIKHRLKVYQEKTKPIIDILKKTTSIITINGDQTIKQVQKEILQKLKKHNKVQTF